MTDFELQRIKDLYLKIQTGDEWYAEDERVWRDRSMRHADYGEIADTSMSERPHDIANFIVCAYHEIPSLLVYIDKLERENSALKDKLENPCKSCGE